MTGFEPDLKIITAFLQDSASLFADLLANTHWDERMKARKTASFGVSYDYSGISYPACEMPEHLSLICLQLEQALGFRPNNCLMNYYPDGLSSMGFHSDSAEELAEGTGVAIISQGSERTIRYRSKADKDIKVNYLLKSGDLLYMDDQVQQEWMHAIPKEPDAGPRISLTFRKIVK